MYASGFKQLACDISWDEVALINQFQFGLHNGVRDLLFTMSNPLSQAIVKLFDVTIDFLNIDKKGIGN
jgi:hypothetical protein